VTLEDTAEHFKQEAEEDRKRRAAIRELEGMIELLERKSTLFHQKARAVELGFHLGLPVHLYKALETVLYDSRPQHRQRAGKLIALWAREGR
jgi:hypothetical protein